MRIFYCITKSEMGGAQTYVWRLLERAKRNGDMAVVMADGEGWLFDRARELGHEVIANPYFKNSFNPINLIRAVLRTRREIKKVAPDVVHGNSGGGGFFGRLASVGLGVKVIFTAHGWSFTDGTPLVRKTIARIAETMMVPFTDTILCVSHNDARLARRYLWGVDGKVQVVHNGVPVSDKIATPGMHEQIHILFVGRLTQPKLPLAILAALASLANDIRTEFNVCIVGDGEQRPLLESYSEQHGLDHQVTIGAVPNEHMASVYAKSDIFILPTQWEGFPMTIVEALMAGLPVVASAVGGIPEAVDDTVGKLLTKGKEAEELAEIFKEIARDRSWLAERGRASRARAIAKFSADTMCDAVWKAYE